MSPADLPLAPDACYLALQTRDARFDGSFFTGVTSTGIYCRPVCRVRTPRPENCRFFTLAAQAESAGFRPCLRCRPELAPQSLRWSVQDASATLAQQAARLLDEPEAWSDEAPSVAALARRLGVSDRHLRRIFEAQLGVSPLQYLQTRRLLNAKQLLADTPLPVTQVALVSGFGSVRRFNAAFTAHYGLSPSALRREGAQGEAACAVRLGYRPPYDVAAMLGFFRTRAIEGLEAVTDTQLARTLALDAGGRRWEGWIRVAFDEERCQVLLSVSDTLYGVLPLVIRRVRAALDLDADPHAINARLHGSFPLGDGLRVPGALSGYELAVRAVLGQQITVAAARTLAQRLVHRFGTAMATPDPALRFAFPEPAVLATAEGDALGQLGIVRQRQGAIVAIARAVAEGRIALHPGADVPATVAALKELPGIGDWTAQYIAMRALRWPDAFPAGDVALHKALGVQQSKQPAREAEAASQAWKPWRSYAVVRAWSALSQGA
ncbi:DNA-3-methyladenine glycosylase 2 family protein [Ramlibacter sp.]|uniref:DNA-3-methyladenine glycosylase 2 family protein n=1 Tax=Ramlibacter sp. TaxID=1917967 RepID=UPI002634DC63|nr:DNA-3-methyladenine glycosylase 2 family protein [Ramlibacter sp.]MDB5955406.1 fusion protein AdaA/AlkA : methylphosphotriester-DNA alkyltransferase and transcriptional [Ramlibacter sp.]